MTLVGKVSSRIAKLPPKSGSVHIVHTMFGNIVYLGFPLINVLFPGGEGLFYAMLFHLASSLIMWTAGINILQNNSKSWLSGLKNLLNPNTFAFLIGFLLLFVDSLFKFAEHPANNKITISEENTIFLPSLENIGKASKMPS